MGNYLNPGNSGFTAIRNSTYVDKSSMIAKINQTIDTTQKLTCVSRPRRFGKSFAAQMLCAYYDRGLNEVQKGLSEYDVFRIFRQPRFFGIYYSGGEISQNFTKESYVA